MHGVVPFGARGKLSPRFIGPDEILKRVGKMAYWLTLLNSLEKVLDVFHVSQSKKIFFSDLSCLRPRTFGVRNNLVLC